jgi:hypothetical protein
MSQKWSKEQDEVLIKRYPAEGASSDLRVLLSKSREVIKHRAYILGLRINKEAVSSIWSRATGGCGSNNRGFRGYKRITGSYIGRLRKGALDRGLEATLLDGSLENLKYLDSIVTDVCPFSGFALRFPSRSRDRMSTASLDRIDPAKGYIMGNVRWVHRDVNEMKWDLTDNEFMSLIKDIDNVWNRTDA